MATTDNWYSQKQKEVTRIKKHEVKGWLLTTTNPVMTHGFDHLCRVVWSCGG